MSNKKSDDVVEVKLDDSFGSFKLAYGNRVEEVKFIHDHETNTNMCVVRLEGGLEIIISANAELDCILTAPKRFIERAN